VQQLDSLFEDVACEICGSDERVPVASRSDLFLGGDFLYHMHKCLGCGVVYQHPRPTPTKMADFYPETYQQYTPALTKEKSWSRFSRSYGLGKRSRFVQRYGRCDRLLDVGCATGDFLEMVQRDGLDQAVGIEPIYSAARYACKEVGLTVIQSVLNHSPFPDETFDTITMWDVLEHVYHPRQVIAEISRLLKPDGILIVNHPNLESLDRRLFGHYWLGYELPRHLYLYPHELLCRVMAEYGLEEVDRRCLYGSHAATASSLMFVINKRTQSKGMLGMIRAFLFSPVTRFFMTPYFKTIDHMHLGSNITEVFRRL
jgi:2-polyprenyl-3-methyl-5-hydroxy-6-metoxy-1,4-benzoquinol methylase